MITMAVLGSDSSLPILSGAPSSRCQSCGHATGTLSRKPHRVRRIPVMMPPTPGGNKYRGDDDPRCHHAPLHPGRKRQAQEREQPDPEQRSDQKPGSDLQVRAGPALRRRITLVDEQQQAGNPRDQRERSEQRGEFAHHVAEARDGMTQQDGKSVVGQIERDQARRDPRSDDQREPSTGSRE